MNCRPIPTAQGLCGPRFTAISSSTGAQAYHESDQESDGIHRGDGFGGSGIDIEGVSHVINDAIPQDSFFLCPPSWSDGTKWSSWHSHYPYQPSDDSDSLRELRWAPLTPKMIKNYEFCHVFHDRDRRANRRRPREKLGHRERSGQEERKKSV